MRKEYENISLAMLIFFSQKLLLLLCLSPSLDWLATYIKKKGKPCFSFSLGENQVLLKGTYNRLDRVNQPIKASPST